MNTNPELASQRREIRRVAFSPETEQLSQYDMLCRLLDMYVARSEGDNSPGSQGPTQKGNTK